MVKGYNLSVVPFMDDKPHGIFATRAPVRPNSIGISIVKLNKVVGNQVYFEGADMLNDTPLIDIKPYFPKYDSLNNASGGWLEEKGNIDISKMKSDARFDIVKPETK